MTGFVEKIKEAVPGTTENKLAKGTGGGVAGHHQHSAGATGLTGGDGYASTTTGGAAYGSGAAAPEYTTTGLGGTAPVTGEHHGHHGHHHGGHHHHHGHTGATNVDTPAETGTEKITKHLPGTEANKEHKANENLGGAGGYGTTNTGAGYGSATGTGYGSTTGAGTGYSSTPNTGLANQGATGYGSTAGHGATGAGFGTVDTSRESTAQGVAKHVPGTDAHREHTANTTGGYGTTGGVTGTTGTGLGGNTTVGTDHETTKDKLLKIIPGTEQHKEKKALKEGGAL